MAHDQDDVDAGCGAGLPSSDHDSGSTTAGAMECHYDPARTKKIYAPKSIELQERVRTLWNSFCTLHGKDPTETLRSFRIQDLYNFFHWMLREGSGRIRVSRTLQTYWNTLTLVRQLETGCFDMARAVQVEMCGVSGTLLGYSSYRSVFSTDNSQGTAESRRGVQAFYREGG
nr:hypothetical protein CFP56_78195 [Quercus suber]